jgi:hypothetical protein
MNAHQSNLAKLAELLNALREYECFSCGESEPMTVWDNERYWKDNGEKCSGMFCKKCLAAKKDELMPC